MTAPLQDRREANRDARRKPGGQAVDQIPPAQRLFAIRRQVNRVAARGERLDHRLEIPEVGEVPGDEEYLHAFDPAVRLTWPGKAPRGPSGSTARRSAAENRPAPIR